MIVRGMQLWDVCEDQTAVDLIRGTKDAQEASKILLDHALKVGLSNSHYPRGRC